MKTSDHPLLPGSLEDPASETAQASGAPSQLLERVLASPGFRRSPRLSSLLVYLAERSLRGPGAGIREQEIGHAVFGRAPDYDTSGDTLVRVQASKLRARLRDYFADEGSSERLVLELPPGGYAVQFRPRFGEDEPPAASAPPAEEEPTGPAGVPFATADVFSRHARRPSGAVLALSAAVAVLGSLCLWLAAGGRLFGRTPDAPLNHAQVFWKQVFGNDSATPVVLSDASLTIVQDLIGRRVTLHEYRSWAGLRGAVDGLKENPRLHQTAERVMGKHFITLSEMTVLRQIEESGRAVGASPQPRFARTMTAGQLADGSVVLLGNGRVNPWVSFFDDRRAFRFRFAEADASRPGGSRRVARPALGPVGASFDVPSPQPGEKASYPVVWGRVSYCAIAFLPGVKPNHTVLIIEGADLASTAAGGEFLTSPQWMGELSKRLSASAGRFPYFEVLLETQLLENRPDRFSIVAHRIHEF